MIFTPAWIKIIVIGISLILGGWFVFDGSRALIAGDYTTAGSGPHAGQLGPWSRLVAAVGIDPRHTMMKIFHVLLGIGWLAALALIFLKPAAARPALIAISVASLWYLPMGAVLGAAELALIFFGSKTL